MRCARWAAAVLVLPVMLTAAHAEIEGPPAPIPTIKQIMNDAHKCTTAYIRIVRQELNKQDVDWYIVEQKSRALVKMGKYLGKNTPPRGSRESWEKLTDLYTAYATILADAAEKQDKTAATQAATKVYMCATCHKAHR